MIFFVGFYTMEYVHGHVSGASTEMVEGQFVYLGVVCLVNAKILTSTSNYSFWSFFFTFSQTLAFVLFFWLLNLFRNYPLYGTFYEVFGDLIAYVSLAFMSGAMVLVDNGLHLAQYEVRRLYEYKERERLKKIKQQSLLDHAVQRRRITNFVRKCLNLLAFRSRLRLLPGGGAGAADHEQPVPEAQVGSPGPL